MADNVCIWALCYDEVRPKRAQAKRSTQTCEVTPTSHSRACDWDTLRQEFIKEAPFVARTETSKPRSPRRGIRIDHWRSKPPVLSVEQTNSVRGRVCMSQLYVTECRH